MELEWSAFALEDMDWIFDSIGEHDPQPAARIEDRIVSQVDRLARLPEGGRPGQIEGGRELVVARTPYIVAYRLLGETVRVLRVVHGSQLWPDIQ